MTKLILLVAFVFAGQLVKGANPPDPEARVTCHNNHTVDITIYNVDDLGEWSESYWQLQSSASCQPAFSGTTVTYTDLFLPDCSMYSKQLSDSIKYVLKINATMGNPGGTGQLRAYDHLYYVSCDYDNQNRSSASFVPIVNRNDNDSSNAFFTFSLQAYPDSDYSGVVPNPIALNTTLYFKAKVETQSANPNLDLFPVHCWSSKSADPYALAADGDFDLIKEGCGNDTVSEDLYDTLFYNCTNDDIVERFSLRTYRYFGEPEGSEVYIHCELRVCLADKPNSACECPSVDECDPANRKRRSIADQVDEDEVYRVSSGPYIFKSEEEEEKEPNEEEGGESDEQDEPESFPTNVAIIAAVCGVVAVAIICATVYLVVRSRNKSGHHRDLNVVT